jgi:hypothetical protein
MNIFRVGADLANILSERHLVLATVTVLQLGGLIRVSTHVLIFRMWGAHLATVQFSAIDFVLLVVLLEEFVDIARSGRLSKHFLGAF